MLPEDLLKDAARVNADAEAALSAGSEWLERGVLSESASFMAELQKRQQDLAGDNMRTHPEIIVKSMEKQATKLFAHLKKE